MNIRDKITDDEFIAAFNVSISKNRLREKLGLPSNGTNQSFVNKKIKQLNLDENVLKQNYETQFFSVQICPVCQKPFKVKKCARPQTTCSYECSNTFFRSGENNGMYKKAENYATIAFRYHEHKCCICGEELIVHVHHYDGNHLNNEITNFVPLCPTHHQYYHSRFRYLVKDKIDEYHQRFTEHRPQLSSGLDSGSSA